MNQNGALTNILALLGRVCFAAIFLWAAYGKFVGFDGTVGYIGSQDIPYPNIMTVIAIIFEGLGGLLILLGWRARFGALLIFLFIIPATYIFHDYWTFPPEQMGDQFTQIGFGLWLR